MRASAQRSLQLSASLLSLSHVRKGIGVFGSLHLVLVSNQGQGRSLDCFRGSKSLPDQRTQGVVSHAWLWDFSLIFCDFGEKHYSLMHAFSVQTPLKITFLN